MQHHRRRMILSIHDVTPASRGQVEQLRAHLTRHSGARTIALLVVPDHWNSTPIARDAAFRAWLRSRHDAGDEIVLHGWHHRDESAHRDWRSRFMASRLTAGEGEFLNLDGALALRRLQGGRALLEDIVGAPIRGFVAPAWLYGDAARAALTQAGFDFAEDHFRIWSPRDGRLLGRGPVITWASRSRSRMISSLGFAALARAALGGLPTVRIAVHPGDTGELAIMDSIRATARSFARTHLPAHYADLLPRPAARAHAPLRNARQDA